MEGYIWQRMRLLKCNYSTSLLTLAAEARVFFAFNGTTEVVPYPNSPTGMARVNSQGLDVRGIPPFRKKREGLIG